MTLHAGTPLAGRRVLILEDEILISMMIESIITDLGCEVVGPFMKVGPALEFLSSNAGAVDLAVLDVNVAGERSFKVAEALSARNVPFVFSTGYDEGGVDPGWQDRPSLRKPYSPQDLEDALRQVLTADSGAST